MNDIREVAAIAFFVFFCASPIIAVWCGIKFFE